MRAIIIIVIIYVSRVEGFGLANDDQKITITNQNYLQSLDMRFFESRINQDHFNITSIDLPSNDFIGIEEDALISFPNLTRLNLTKNKISFVYFNAPKLRSLDLSDNLVDEIDLEPLSSLIALHLSGNKFTKVEWTLGDSPISEIDLSYNLLLEEVIIESENLETLSLQHTNIKHLKLNAPKLECVDFREGKITTKGDIDRLEAICQMNSNRNFKVLYYDSNEIQTFYHCSSSMEESDEDVHISDTNVRAPRSHSLVQSDNADSNTDLKKTIPSTLSSNVPKPAKRKNSVNCNLSTLRIEIDDIVLSPTDYFLLEISFYTLVSLIILLSIGNGTVAYLYIRNKKYQQ